jgi:hypothetical protein
MTKQYYQKLAQRESSNNPKAVNNFGFIGLYQMGEPALIDTGYYKPDGTQKNDWVGEWTGKD